MKFLTLTRIAALLATSAGLASASTDVCAGGVKLECSRNGVTLLGSLDSMDPLEAFRSIRKFLESGCDGACLSPQLKAELCEKAHSIIKPLIQERIYLEDIEQCFADTAAKDESCHVSYECPPGTPEGKICLTEICDHDGEDSKLCLGNGEYLGPAFSTPDSLCKEKCCSGSCHVGNTCHPGSPEGSICLSTVCSPIDVVLKGNCTATGGNIGKNVGQNQSACRKKCCSKCCEKESNGRNWYCTECPKEPKN